MSREFSVEIIRPDKSIMSKKVDEAILPCFEGEVTILKDHIPLITFLRPGLIKIVEETEKILFVEEGTVEFANNNLLILTSTAKELSDLNQNYVNKLISESEVKMKNIEITDKEKYLLSYKIETLKSINQ